MQTDDTSFAQTVTRALRPDWWLRAAAARQFLRQQILRRRVRASADGKPTLLVYQMGKVGSTNLQRDLQAQAPGLNVFQVHRMHSPYIDALYKRYRANAQAPYYFSNYVGREIHRQVIAPAQGGEVRILCAVREPIARNVSHFFQDIERFIPRAPLPARIEEVTRIFVDRFEHDYPEDWFDNEFLPVTGIDVLGHDFDPDKGFSVLRNGRISALVYRIESTGSAEFVSAFEDFTGLSYPPEARHNVGGAKKYGALYTAFKSARALPHSFCEAQHQTRYATTFYSPAELAAARHKLCAS